MSNYEEILQLLKKSLNLGTKTAERLFTKIVVDDNFTDELVAILQKIDEHYDVCPVCFAMREDLKCSVCDNPLRDQSRICVVGNIMDLMNIEKTKTYNGLYHVLNGEISLSHNITPDKLTIEELEARINDKIKEVVIATSTTFEGELTAQYLKKNIERKNIAISRIAKGLPIGSSFDYADELTIKKAIEDRKKI